jgi:hypothetical protein
VEELVASAGEIAIVPPEDAPASMFAAMELLPVHA